MKYYSEADIIHFFNALNKSALNYILLRNIGNELPAELLIGKDIDLLIKKTDEEKTALDTWKDALSNVMPHVEVRSRRVGGATFQIPMQIRPDRKVSTAMKWLIGYARKRNEKSMSQRLASEILAAAKEEGAAVKKRVDTHKMAEANKAFSHFRF